MAAVAAGLSLTLTACTPGSGGTGGNGGETVGPAYTLPTPTGSEIESLEGDVAAPTGTEEPLMGRIAPAESIEGELIEDTTEEAPELLGDVAYFPETPEDLPTEAP